MQMEERTSRGTASEREVHVDIQRCEARPPAVEREPVSIAVEVEPQAERRGASKPHRSLSQS